MSKITLTHEKEEKRLKVFQEIAENWDELPEKVQAKIDGITSMAATIFLDTSDKRVG